MHGVADFLAQAMGGAVVTMESGCGFLHLPKHFPLTKVARKRDPPGAHSTGRDALPRVRCSALAPASPFPPLHHLQLRKTWTIPFIFPHIHLHENHLPRVGRAVPNADQISSAHPWNNPARSPFSSACGAKHGARGGRRRGDFPGRSFALPKTSLSSVCPFASQAHGGEGTRRPTENMRKNEPHDVRGAGVVTGPHVVRQDWNDCPGKFRANIGPCRARFGRFRAVGEPCGEGAKRDPWNVATAWFQGS